MRTFDRWTRSAGRGRHLMPTETAAAIDSQFWAAEGATARAGGAGALAEIDGMVLNVRPDPVDFRDRIYEPRLVPLQTVRIPPAADGIRFAVRDQGAEGSCTGQALAAVIDMQNIAYHEAKADVPQRVSARMLYEQARLFDEFADDRLPGSSARGAIKAFFHNGVCGADLVPYVDGDVSFRLTAPIAKDAKRVTLGAYFRLQHILNHYHAALNEAEAIFCTAMIHRGWRSEKVSAQGGRIRLPPGGAPKATLEGAHAFAIVGYDCTGFIVLNSWGPAWGGFDPADAVPGQPSVPGGLPGAAHWSYEDWRAHVLDAWVLRLQAPAGKPSGYVGGYTVASKPELQSGFQLTRPAEPNFEILGHYLHIKDGRFCAEPPYSTTEDTLQETIRHLVDDVARDDGEPSKYDHVLFYAHGGLNDLRNAAARAAAMTEGFKRNRIWPIFFLWRTGLAEIAGDLFLEMRDRLLGRAAGLQDLTDVLIEEAARRLVRPFWKEMKSDAFEGSNAASADDEHGAAAWRAVRAVSEAVAARSPSMKVHFVGHSAGAVFLAHLFARDAREGGAILGNTGTVSLFAPACDIALFDGALRPVAKALTGPDRRFSVYNLADDAERDDVVGDVYGKSLLYLVSNAFEPTANWPLAGLDRDFAAISGDVDYHVALQGRKKSRATRHGGFDNDPATMNDVLSRVVGRPVTARTGGFNAAELSESRF